MKKLFFVALLLVFSTLLYGAEFRRLGADARALGMGNTGITNARSSSVLFYNPALLSNRRSLRVAAGTQVHLNSDFLALIHQLGFKIADFSSPDNIISLVSDNIDRTPYIKGMGSADLIYNFTPVGWAIGGGYAMEYLVDINIDSPIIPRLNLYARQDQVYIAGVSLPLDRSPGAWVIAVSGRYVNRAVSQFSYSLKELSQDKEIVKSQLTDKIKKTGYGFDIGLLYRIPGRSFYSILGTTWHSGVKFSSLRVPDIPSELGIGASTVIPFSYGMLELACDMRDVLFQADHIAMLEEPGSYDSIREIAEQAQEHDSKSFNIVKRMHIGTEFGFLPFGFLDSILALRLGFNQGHFTYGAGLNLLGYLNFDYAYYVEEAGSSSTQRSDSRHVIKFSMAI